MTYTKRKLAIVTPAKNESNNVFKLVESVSKLDYTPDLWIFVNDDSDDNTEDKFIESIRSFPSLQEVCDIKLVRHISEDKSYALGNKYSSVVKYGFEYLLKHEYEYNIKYEYIGILDCDIILPENYYSYLIKMFQSYPDLGIISGGKQLEVDVNNVKNITFCSKTHAPSGFRVWRRECFNDTGYYISISQDSVSEARAVMLGWKVRSYEELSVTMRKRGDNFNYEYYGKSDYFRWIPMYYAITKKILMKLKGHDKDALLYYKGYIEARNNRITRINDDLVRKYFRYRLFYKLLGR